MKLPNELSDTTAIERMKQHFPMPSDLMPFAWFMNGNIDYFPWSAEDPPTTFMAYDLCVALNEIAGGIVAFPESYVSVWREWFKYLLSYTIARADELKNGDYGDSVLVAALTALMSVYPREIPEEYAGFREDVIRLLGTRLISLAATRNAPDFDVEALPDPVDSFRWTNRNLLYSLFLTPKDSVVIEEFSLSMLFGLRYLTPSEIAVWVKAIIEVNNPPWHLSTMRWWMALNKFLTLSRKWPEDGNIQELVNVESGLITTFWVYTKKYAYPDQFIPFAHLEAFQSEFKRQLTHEAFKVWSADLLSYLKQAMERSPYNMRWRLRLLALVDWNLYAFEEQFFDRYV